MVNLLPWRRRMRLPREKMDLDVVSCWCLAAGWEESLEVMEDAGDRRDEDVVVVVEEEVVLLLERATKVESRLGLLLDWATTDLERERYVESVACSLST